MTNLLEVRRKLKSKKPKFLRQDANRLHLPKKWVRPRGIHSKMRLKIKGHKARPSTGFGSPRKVKFTLRSGLFPVLVYNKSMLDIINIKTQAAILSSALGKKKRLEILEYAISKNIAIHNIKDAKNEIEKIRQEVEQRKNKTQLTKQKKKSSKEESLKKAEQKQKEKTQEEQKQEEKEQQKEILQKQEIPKHAPKMQQKHASDKIAKKDSVRTRIPEGGDRGVQK